MLVNKFIIGCVMLFIATTLCVAETITDYEQYSFGFLSSTSTNGGRISIDENINNPVLLNVNSNEIDGAVKTIMFTDAQLISSTSDEAVISVNSSSELSGDGEGVNNITLHLGVWLDNERKLIEASQVNNSVLLNVTSDFEIMKVKVVRSVSFNLKKDFKGEFNSNLEIKLIGIEG